MRNFALIQIFYKIIITYCFKDVISNFSLCFLSLFITFPMMSVYVIKLPFFLIVLSDKNFCLHERFYNNCYIRFRNRKMNNGLDHDVKNKLLFFFNLKSNKLFYFTNILKSNKSHFCLISFFMDYNSSSIAFFAFE